MILAGWPLPERPRSRDEAHDRGFDAESVKHDRVTPEPLNDECPWCGHPRDCQPYEPGKSPHHFLCCADQYGPSCMWGRPNDLARIMREDREAEWS